MRYLLSIYSLILCFLCAIPLESAAPLTHLYIGDLFLKYYNVEDRKAFLLGNIYPDIRYMSNVSRANTHRTDVSLDEIIKEEDSFKKGCLLHCYVDVLREELVEILHIYDMLEPVDRGYKSQLLKFIEDEYLSSRCQTAEYVQINTAPIKQEYQHNLQLIDLQKWHLFISGYLTIKPSMQMYLLSMITKEMFGIPSHILYEWSYEIPKLANDPYLEKYTKYMINQIERTFTRRKSINLVIREKRTQL
ncbi:MAG: hypothetical protein S4CHLAM37_06900 [Chlamydiia bacterium]|nr:hypothetical protein [Chlamydiia bacterium]